MSTLEDDIRFARSLAESGQLAPLLGGRILAWWGGLAAVAYALHYGFLTGLIETGDLKPGPVFGVLWLAFVAVGSLGYWWLCRRYPFQLAGSGSAANQAERAIWIGAGGALAAVIAGAVIRSVIEGRPELYFPWTIPAVFGLFAAAQLSVGIISRQRVLYAAGAMGWLVTVICFASAGHPEQFVLAAVGALLALMVPGIILWRREPSKQP